MITLFHDWARAMAAFYTHGWPYMLALGVVAVLAAIVRRHGSK